MIVVVCGSRDWGDGAAIYARLSALPGEHEDIVIIHGACSRKDPVTGEEVSADMLADKAARELGFTPWQHHADWERYGKRAGPRRNRAMLDRCPDLVLAFQRNGSRGTQDCVDEARQRGIAVEVHTPDSSCANCGGLWWEDAEDGGRCINCGTPHPNMADVHEA